MANKQKPNKKLDELRAGWVRTQADFDNYKKMVEQDKTRWTSSAREDALFEILPILDNLHFATKHKPQELQDNGWATGIDHIANQVEDKLRELGVDRVSPKANDRFDPTFHEAVASIPGSKIKSGNIIDLVRPGYKIADKIIRPAQVNVSK